MRSTFFHLSIWLALAVAIAEQGCPEGPQGAALAQKAAAHNAPAPFIFSGQQLQRPCQGGTDSCINPLPYGWEAFCSYSSGLEHIWRDYMLCTPEQRDAILRYYTSSKSSGFADMLAFSPCDLWPLIRGRTLWIVGDSHSYDLFHALACLLAGLWDYHFDGPLPVDSESDAFDAMSAHVLHFKPPECLPLLEGTLVCMVRVNHGQVLIGHALPLLARMAKPTDIAIAGFAHWHGTADSGEYHGLLRDFKKAVEQGQGSLPRFVWLEAVPTHYKQQHGLFPGGSAPYECAPLHVKLQSDGTLAASDDWSGIILEGGHHNKAAREVFAGSGIAMTQFWNATVEVWKGHRVLSDGRGQECAHNCFPGVPNVWVYHVYQAIRDAPWSQ